MHGYRTTKTFVISLVGCLSSTYILLSLYRTFISGTKTHSNWSKRKCQSFRTIINISTGLQVTLNMTSTHTIHHVIPCVDIEIFIFKAPCILQFREPWVGWSEYSHISWDTYTRTVSWLVACATRWHNWTGLGQLVTRQRPLFGSASRARSLWELVTVLVFFLILGVVWVSMPSASRLASAGS